MVTAQDLRSTTTTPASTAEAYDKICRVTEWWTQTVDGKSGAKGDAFTVRFGETFTDFVIDEAIPGHKLVWRVTNCYLPWQNNKTEWNGTSVVWEISERDGGSAIALTHHGLVPGAECFEDCQRGWDFFVGESLHQFITDGVGRPELRCRGKAADVENTNAENIMSNQIEKKIELKAPISRVWRALTDHKEFGEWFSVAIDQPFQAGQTSTGKLTIPGYEHVEWWAVVQKIEPETLFSYTWHPYAIDKSIDYSEETPTLVEFRLAPAGGGTLLTVTESGFDNIPNYRREEAMRMNDHGWAAQLKCIDEYVTTVP